MVNAALIRSFRRPEAPPIQFIRLDLVLESIDELRRLQDKLIRAEKLSALGRMTSDVAHEIRNPLTAVGGFARRLEHRLPEGAVEKRYARIIVSEVGRLERILEDTLSYSRDAKYRLVHTNINDLLPEIGETSPTCAVRKR